MRIRKNSRRVVPKGAPPNTSFLVSKLNCSPWDDPFRSQYFQDDDSDESFPLKGPLSDKCPASDSIPKDDVQTAPPKKLPPRPPPPSPACSKKMMGRPKKQRSSTRVAAGAANTKFSDFYYYTGYGFGGSSSIERRSENQVSSNNNNNDNNSNNSSAVDAVKNGGRDCHSARDLDSPSYVNLITTEEVSSDDGIVPLVGERADDEELDHNDKDYGVAQKKPRKPIKAWSLKSLV